MGPTLPGVMPKKKQPQTEFGARLVALLLAVTETRGNLERRSGAGDALC